MVANKEEKWSIDGQIHGDRRRRHDADNDGGRGRVPGRVENWEEGPFTRTATGWCSSGWTRSPQEGTDPMADDRRMALLERFRKAERERVADFLWKGVPVAA